METETKTESEREGVGVGGGAGWLGWVVVGGVPGPQTTGVMKGPGPSHLSSVLPCWDALLPCPTQTPTLVGLTGE